MYKPEDNDLPIMVIKRIDLEYINKTYGDANVTVSRISRKDFAVTVYVNLIKKFPSDIYIDILVKALYSNTYRRTPLSVENLNVCAVAKHKYMKYAENIESIKKYGNIPTSCPILPGFYYLKNYVYDATNVPPLPWKDIVTEVTVYFDKDNLLAKSKTYIVNNQDEIKFFGDLRG